MLSHWTKELRETWCTCLQEILRIRRHVVQQPSELKVIPRTHSDSAKEAELIVPILEESHNTAIPGDDSLESLPPIARRVGYENLKLSSVQTESVASLQEHNCTSTVFQPAAFLQRQAFQLWDYIFRPQHGQEAQNRLRLQLLLE